MAIPTTIEDQIDNVKEKDIAYRTTHTTAFIKDTSTNEVIEIPFVDIIVKYKNFLEPIVLTKTLTDDLFFKYRYRPKRLSNDLYGNVELWNVLMTLNNAKSIMEFAPKVLKYYDPERLKSYINEILILEGVL